MNRVAATLVRNCAAMLLCALAAAALVLRDCDAAEEMAPAGGTLAWTPAVKPPSGEEFLRQSRQRQAGLRARNVILCIGDGMGIHTVTAARILAGQRAGGAGVDSQLSFEKFPYTAFSKTWSADHLTTDSAAGMNAPMTGRKCRNELLGVDESATLGAASVAGHEAKTFLEICKERGKAVGVVTTTRVTHATPAACYAHIGHRGWECDADVAKGVRGVRDIAVQLIEFPGGVDVAFGGGRSKFLRNDQADPLLSTQKGSRRDGRDLTAEWRERGGACVYDKASMNAATSGRVLGLFTRDYMTFNLDRKTDAEPTLTEMTVKAIELLSRDPDGFFLMVEGGMIDTAHHQNQANRALDETIEFSKAVQAAVDHTDAAETLIIATADHSHSLTFVGGAAMNTRVNGIAFGTGGPMQDANGDYCTFMVYGGGPVMRKRPDLYFADTTNKDYRFEGAMQIGGSTHSCEDVPVYATGPGAQHVHGSMDNTFIFHVMMEAIGANSGTATEKP